jgi:cation transport protein ChaC
MRLLSQQELDAGRERAFAGQAPDEDLYVFGYGSLMWRPEAQFTDPVVASIDGWQRSFCLWQWRYRGTPEAPGLVLALEPGGRCEGLLFRVPARQVRAGAASVWNREMVGNGYRPLWLDAQTPAGRKRALTFIVNEASERYARGLSEEDAAQAIANACGHIGPSAVYLLETALKAAELGIDDPLLWRLEKRVAHIMRACIGETLG